MILTKPVKQTELETSQSVVVQGGSSLWCGDRNAALSSELKKKNFSFGFSFLKAFIQVNLNCLKEEERVLSIINKYINFIFYVICEMILLIHYKRIEKRNLIKRVIRNSILQVL